MNLSKKLKPLDLKYYILAAFFLNTIVFWPILAADSNTTIGDLSARIGELEEQLGKKGDNSDDANPGAKVSQEDLERLKDEIRALRNAQSGAEDMSSLREELRNLREDVRHLKSENTELRQKEKSDLPEDTPKKSSSFVADSREESPISKKRKRESWNQTQTPSTVETDEETESVLKILEQSAPEEDGEDNPPKKKQKKNLEDRESATKHAEETAPQLTTGTIREKNSFNQYNAALAHYNRGEYKKAEIAFSDFIKEYKDNSDEPLIPQAMYWKAESTMKLGNNTGAQLLFVTAYKKNPKSPNAANCLLRLGETFALLDKKENACVAWKKLEDDFPHMTDEMKTELSTLKNQYGCKKKSEKPKAAPKASMSVVKN